MTIFESDEFCEKCEREVESTDDFGLCEGCAANAVAYKIDCAIDRMKYGSDA